MTEIIKQRIEQIKQGKVPHGYKKTEVGIVPQEWESDNALGDIFNFYGGLGISREQLGNNGVPYLHYGDMHKEYFTKATYEKYSQLPKYETKLKGDETYLLNDGDMVFLDASEDLAGTSRCVVVDNAENLPFISGLHTFVAKPKSQVLNKEYSQYLTAPQMVKKQFERLASGFKVYGLNRNTVKKVCIAYPKEPTEQERIAEILSKWDSAVELQENLIIKLEIQKKALMQKLLTPKNGWKKIKVGTLTKELSIRNKNNDCKNIKSVSNRFGFINQDEQFSKQVASQDTSNYKKVNYGNVAYNPSRINVGSIAIYEDNITGIVSPMYVVFKCINIEPKLLLLLLSTDRGQYDIKTYLTGSVRDSLNYSDLENIEIRLPDEISQKKIVNIFEIIEQSINLQTQKLTKLKQQQKAMQQLLLTGIVRVTK